MAPFGNGDLTRDFRCVDEGKIKETGTPSPISEDKSLSAHWFVGCRDFHRIVPWLG
jgi:hypothetical protein